jgi:uncharacterized protein (TIGR00369 family)
MSCKNVPAYLKGNGCRGCQRYGGKAEPSIFITPKKEAFSMVDQNEYEEISPNFKSALIKKTRSVHPFWKLLGMELVDVKKGWAVVKLPFDKKLTQADGIAHGGSTFAAADAAVAMALIGMIDRNETMVTLEMKLNYTRPFSSGSILAEAVIVQKGSTTALGEVSVKTDKNELIAKGLATYRILPRRKSKN